MGVLVISCTHEIGIWIVAGALLACSADLDVKTRGAGSSTLTGVQTDPGQGSSTSTEAVTSADPTAPDSANSTSTATQPATETSADSDSTSSNETAVIDVDTLPPLPFAITGPAALLATAIPVITWEAADGADTYRLTIAATIDCDDPLQTYPDLRSTTQTLTVLADGDYFACVDAADAAGNATSATPRAFTIDTTPPAPFSIVGPSTPGTEPAPSVTWSAAVGATSYELTLATAGDCSGELQSYAPLTTTARTLSTLGDGTYYACVTARDDAGNLRPASNNAYAFVIDTTPPSVTLGPKRTAGNSFTIRPSVSDISSLTYAWSQLSGPGTVSFGSPSAKDTLLAASVEGDYVLRLTVTDQVGHATTADVALTWDRSRMVSAARHDSCAIKAGGQLYCWGRNNVGGVGSGNMFLQASPVLVDFGSQHSATSVSVGSFHSCAILDDSSVRCWGTNAATGYGDTAPRLLASADEAVDLGAGRSAQALASGFGHTCALLDDATVKCWGSNTSGKLGLGDTTDRSTVPAETVNLGVGRTARKVAAGEHFSCALLDDGTIKCWGSNNQGQLGYGDTNDRWAPPDQPISLPGGLTAKELAAGRQHTCAILSDDTIACWGWNGAGHLGDRTLTTRTTPVLVNGFTGTPTRLTLGTAHSCALRSDATVSCWGNQPIANGAGRLSAITACSDGVSPTSVACSAGGGIWNSALTYDCSTGVSTSPDACTASGGSWGACSDATKVSAGSCAGTWDPSKFAYCSKSDGTQTATQYCTSTGGAITNDGYCRDSAYATRAACLGAGKTWHIARAPGPDLSVGTGRSVLAIEASTNGAWTCAVLDNFELKCWGDNGFGQLGYGDSYFNTNFAAVDLGSGETAQAVTAASNHTCALTGGGGVKCWGSNLYGKLGTGNFSDAFTPTSVSLATTATQVSAASHHSCAVLSDGTIQCWGNNANGRLGNGNITESASPTAVVGLAAAAVEVAAGLDFSCARLVDGTVQCWGNPTLGRLGIGIAAGAPPCSDGIQTTSAACTTAGGIWNGHLYYDCSNGISTSAAACQAVSNGTWAHCRNGQSSTSALCASAGQTWDPSLYSYCTSGSAVTTATAFCTNNGGAQGSYGYCADSTYKTRSSCLNASKTWHVTTLPGATVDLGGVPATQIVTLGATACALLQGGSVRCWGSNASLQIGVGDSDATSSYLVPAAPVDFAGHTVKKLSKSGNPCAILDDDTLRCWGYNVYSQTGNPSATSLYAAPSTTAPDFGAGRSVLTVASSGTETCVLVDDGSLRCFGNMGINDWWSQHSATFSLADMLLAPLSLGTTNTPTDLAVTGSNFCFITQSDGTLRCAGLYSSGQQGRGLPSFRLLPPATAVLNLGP